MRLVVQADAQGLGTKRQGYYKKLKARTERRRAKRDPECQPAYSRYKGYLL